MFGKKAKLNRLKQTARNDYLKCSSLAGIDQLERLFIARIGERSRINLDKIFVQGARDEEHHQEALIAAFKANRTEAPTRQADHDGFNSLKGVSGSIMSWVPEVYATQMYLLGRDYQTQQKDIFEVLEVADDLASKIEHDLQLSQPIVLLKLLRG